MMFKQPLSISKENTEGYYIIFIRSKKISFVKNNKIRYMTEEESVQATILSKNSFFKEKYRHALKLTTKIKVYQSSQTNPEWSAKDVLIAIMKGYNSQLPSAILLEMAQFIVSEWETIQATKNDIIHV